MDRMAAMQLFIRVVEQGSFARAADDLGVSRPSATAAVAQLETQLGVRLLNRTTRSLSLTDEGRDYYQGGLRVLSELAELEDGLGGKRRVPRGRLRVSVPQSFVTSIFYPALSTFSKRFPQLQIEVVLADRAVNLIEEGIDCALRAVSMAADLDLVAREVCPAYWITCAAPDYLNQRGCPSSVQALSEHSLIGFISQSTGRIRPWEFGPPEQRIQLNPEGQLYLNSLDAVIQVALAGAGIVQAPDSLVFPHVLSGRLQVLLAEHIASAPSIHVVYPANRYLTAKVRAFADHFTEVFRQRPWWPRIRDEALAK